MEPFEPGGPERKESSRQPSAREDHDAWPRQRHSDTNVSPDSGASANSDSPSCQNEDENKSGPCSAVTGPGRPALRIAHRLLLVKHWAPLAGPAPLLDRLSQS